MQPAKINVAFSFFPYGGNGGTSQETPAIRNWFARTYLAAKSDPRVGEIFNRDYSDTPITMTRNAAVYDAKMAGADILVMCDSDQHPDVMLGSEPGAVRFWDSSFDFYYKRRMLGKYTVIGAPYCGPPPYENVYVFRWASWETGTPQPNCRIEQYCREEAAARSGFEEVAALPTGLILFDLRCFALLGDELGLIQPPWFQYEYADKYQMKKDSTEDVTATRDISMSCQTRLGYNPMFCNWDSWAGHYKPKCVIKPCVIKVDAVGEKYRHAVLLGQKAMERMVQVQPEQFETPEHQLANGQK